jgi:hypothetical protein
MAKHGLQEPAGVAPAAITFDHLRHQFGRRWELRFEPVISMLTAEQRSADGCHIRYLVAADAAKIERAEQAAP